MKQGFFDISENINWEATLSLTFKVFWSYCDLILILYIYVCVSVYVHGRIFQTKIETH